AHTTTGCGKQGFPSAQPYLSHTPGANPFCCMFLQPCFSFYFFYFYFFLSSFATLSSTLLTKRRCWVADRCDPWIYTYWFQTCVSYVSPILLSPSESSRT
ncbi:hypothetical protein BO86DRAFT_436023, partial [Aspergillus japonicus CBS 114.51]